MSKADFPYATPGEFINKLRSTFYVMVGIPLPAFLMVYLLARDGTYTPPVTAVPELIKWIIPIICLVLIVYAYVQYEKVIRSLRKSGKSFTHRLAELFTASKKKYMWLEVSTVLGVSVYVLTGDVVFAGVYIVLLIFFAMSNPTVHSISADLHLPKKEKQQLIKNEPFSPD